MCLAFVFYIPEDGNLLCTSLHITTLQTLLHHLTAILTKLRDFNCAVIPTHYKYICILALFTLKMAT